jgi:hypothetical protein
MFCFIQTRPALHAQTAKVARTWLALRGSPEEVLMERFLSQRNIDRYRRILANPRDELQRQMVAKLLAEKRLR